MRWRLLAGVSLLAAVAPAPAAHAAVPVLVIDGKGWGHGVGMAQDGAYWMGVAGAKTPDILGHFYPGTAIGRGSGTVRVGVFDAPSRDTVVAFPNGGDVRDALSGQQSPGFPVTVGPGGQVHVWFDGSRYHAEAVGGRPAGSAVSRSATRAQVGVTATTAPSVPSSSTTSTTGPAPTIAPPLTTTTTRRPAPPPTQPQTPPPPPPPTPAPAPPAASTRPLWAVPSGSSVTAVPARGRQYRGAGRRQRRGPRDRSPRRSGA